MAALIEGVRWRESKRGNRFVLCDLSDSSGQFSGSCFEEEHCNSLAELAKEGRCALLDVELDQLSADENPRVAIRQVRPLDSLEKITRTKMELDILNLDGLHELKNLLVPLAGGKSELVVKVASLDDRYSRLSLGRSFQLDAEIVELLNKVNGIENVKLGPAGTARPKRSAKPNLRLVS